MTTAIAVSAILILGGLAAVAFPARQPVRVKAGGRR